MAVSLLRTNITGILKRIAAPYTTTMERQRDQCSCKYNTYPEVSSKIFSRVHEARRKAETGDFEIPKLFLVERIATHRDVPYYEKRILETLDILASRKDTRRKKIRRPMGSVTIVQNTPFMCKMLWKVKHLIRVYPITFPDGEPKEEDYKEGGTHLDRNGVFRITPKLRVEEERLITPPDFEKTRLQTEYIRKVLHSKWKNSL